MHSRRKFTVTSAVLLLFFIAIVYYYEKSLDDHTSTIYKYQVQKKLHSYCLNNNFENVLLIIIFNHPLYDHIPILQKLYGNVFPNIVFCGNESSDVYNILKVDIYKGYYSYKCLEEVLKYEREENISKLLKTDFCGYLVIMDDVLLNIWNYKDLNRSLIWEGPKFPLKFSEFIEMPWYWWNSRWGLQNCRNALKDMLSINQTNREPTLMLEDKETYIFHLLTNYNSKTVQKEMFNLFLLDEDNNVTSSGGDQSLNDEKRRELINKLSKVHSKPTNIYLHHMYLEKIASLINIFITKSKRIATHKSKGSTMFSRYFKTRNSTVYLDLIIWFLQNQNPYEYKRVNEKRQYITLQKFLTNLLKDPTPPTNHVREKDGCFGGRSDIYYIPKRFKNKFEKLSQVFYKNKVFLEIAIPTILRMLDSESNIHLLNGIYLPGRVKTKYVFNSSYLWHYYNYNIQFIHPIKFHYKNGSSRENLDKIQNQILPIIHQLTSC